MTPKHKQQKEKLDKLAFTKIKSFCALKVKKKESERSPQNGRKYLKIIYPIRGLYLEHGKNFYKSIRK